MSRTGGVYNGCDCEDGQVFSSRRGQQDTLKPQVTRSGELLQVTASISSSEIPKCKITENEAFVDVKIEWDGNYISRITSYGLKYRIHGSNAAWTIDSHIPGSSICGNTTIQLVLQSLSPNTTYDVRAFVVTPSTTDTVWSESLSLTTRKHFKCEDWVPSTVFQTSQDIEEVKDHQENVYGVVQIGNRCWMRENMRATTSPKGNVINVNDVNMDSEFPTSFTEAHLYNNDAANEDYGVLYNWCAATDTFYEGESTDPWSCILPPNHRGICPEGWHLPTNEEWTDMEKTLNNNNDLSSQNAGMLAGGCDWPVDNSESSPGNDQYSEWGKSGFDALPSGYFKGTMSGSGEQAFFWTSSEKDAENAYQRNLSYNSSGMDNDALLKDRGLSVRCIRNIPIMYLRLADGDCDKGNVEVVMIPDKSGDFHYEWKVNDNIQIGETNKSISFDFGNATAYHVVCKAIDPSNVVAFEESLDIELPSLTPLVDSFAAAIVIQNPHNLTAANWKLNDVIVDTATSGWVSGLQSGVYVVEMYNGDKVCKTSNDILLKVVHTSCSVVARNPNEVGPDNTNIVDSVQDVSGNWYRVVQYFYNDQWHCWLRENMRADSSCHGTTEYKIVCRNLADYLGDATGIANAGKYYYYNPLNNNIPLEHRGYLYNWNAAKVVCPDGWELPELEDWQNLWDALKEQEMGNQNRSGMMASGYYWIPSNPVVQYSPGDLNYDDRNKTKFSAVPAGNMQKPNNNQAEFKYAYEEADFWTNTKVNNSSSVYIALLKNNRNYMGDTNTFAQQRPNTRAFSVRCIRKN